MFMDLLLVVGGVILAIIGTQDAVKKYMEKYGGDPHIATRIIDPHIATGIDPHVTAAVAVPH